MDRHAVNRWPSLCELRRKTRIWGKNLIDGALATVLAAQVRDRAWNDIRCYGELASAHCHQSETGLNYNYNRDYDPLAAGYIESDPVGLRGGTYSTYAYAGEDPVRNFDSKGLMCLMSVGCWTTPAEATLAASGNFDGYYQLACAGGDDYACVAQGIEQNSSLLGHFATDRLMAGLSKMAAAQGECLNVPAVLNQIRADLASAYANYLPQDEADARWPSVEDIAALHWNVFAQFDLPASTFGGTPYGESGPVVLGPVWCPNCGSPALLPPNLPLNLVK
jgi:RHS repeat-associated protein